MKVESLSPFNSWVLTHLDESGYFIEIKPHKRIKFRDGSIYKNGPETVKILKIIEYSKKG